MCKNRLKQKQFFRCSCFSTAADLKQKKSCSHENSRECSVSSGFKVAPFRFLTRVKTTRKYATNGVESL
jgi:hypothetical protein